MKKFVNPPIYKFILRTAISPPSREMLEIDLNEEPADINICEIAREHCPAASLEKIPEHEHGALFFEQGNDTGRSRIAFAGRKHRSNPNPRLSFLP